MFKLYFPNACRFCQRFDKDMQLIRCEKCNMVSYCCKLHQELNLSQHSGLCNAIQEAFAENRLQHLGNVIYQPLKNWIMVKLKIKKGVELKLQRPFQDYEWPILLYPRTCVVCRKRIGSLINCPNCPYVSFCLKHKNSPMHEEETCQQMAMLFKTSMFCAVRQSSIIYFMKNIQCVYPDDTYSMHDYLAFYEDIRLRYNIPSDILKIIHSGWFTQALTVFHGLRITNYTSNGGRLLIHIIVMQQNDLYDIWAWECIFHLLPTVTTITVTYLHTFPQRKSDGILPLCDECKNKKKMLTYRIYPLVYITCTEYEKPDAFVLWDQESLSMKIDIGEDTYRSLIRILFKQRRLCIFTSSNLNNMIITITNIKKILENDVSPIYQGENPFRSITPVLNAFTESIKFQNSYLFIYQHPEGFL